MKTQFKTDIMAVPTWDPVSRMFVAEPLVISVKWTGLFIHRDSHTICVHWIRSSLNAFDLADPVEGERNRQYPLQFWKVVELRKDNQQPCPTAPCSQNQ